MIFSGREHVARGKPAPDLYRHAAERAGLALTEQLSMTPGASVSGLYFAHPESRYFNVGRIDKEQVEDYARRKQMTVEEMERWLSPNLGY